MTCGRRLIAARLKLDFSRAIEQNPAAFKKQVLRTLGASYLHDGAARMIHGLVAALRMLYQGKSIKDVLRAQIPDFDQLDSGKLSSRAAVFQNSARLSESDFPGSSGQHGHLTQSPPMLSNFISSFQGPLRKWHKLHPCAFATLYASSKAALSAINLQRPRGIGLLPDRRSRGSNRGSRGAGLPQAHVLLGQTRILRTIVCAAP